jgi:hypothetical protein
MFEKIYLPETNYFIEVVETPTQNNLKLSNSGEMVEFKKNVIDIYSFKEYYGENGDVFYRKEYLNKYDLIFLLKKINEIESISSIKPYDPYSNDIPF